MQYLNHYACSRPYKTMILPIFTENVPRKNHFFLKEMTKKTHVSKKYRYSLELVSKEKASN